MKKYILILLVFFGSLQASNDCGNETFNLTTSGSGDGARIYDVLEQLSAQISEQSDSEDKKDCGFSIILRDNAAKNKLNNTVPTLNMRGMPLEKLFDVLLSENDLHYDFDGKILRISYLTTETFKINYISTSRTGTSSTDIILSQSSGEGSSTSSSSSTDGGSSGQAGTINSSSGTKITSTDGYDFWEKIKDEIFEITFRPGDEYRPQKPSSEDDDATTTEGGSIVDGVATDGKVKKANTSEGIVGEAVVVNKAAGLISVTGTVKQIERARKYIKDLETQLQNQVLIDVNILTVTHNNGNTVGVDWNQLYNIGNLTVPSQSAGGVGGEGNPIIGGKSSGLQVFTSGFSLTRIIEFLNRYGTVRSVSNPKVLTLSNQPALISVGSILRYKKTSAYITATSGGQSTSEDTEYPSVFAGVLLDVTPSIQGEYIMLKINPSITKTKDTTVENQATALEEPPNLSASQLSSLIRARDGDKIVIGGLINKSAANTKNRVPLLGYIPIVKYLFSYDSVTEDISEMVIVITPHIIKKNENPSLQDLGYSETVNEIVRTGDAKANINDIGEDEL